MAKRKNVVTYALCGLLSLCLIGGIGYVTKSGLDDMTKSSSNAMSILLSDTMNLKQTLAAEYDEYQKEVEVKELTDQNRDNISGLVSATDTVVDGNQSNQEIYYTYAEDGTPLYLIKWGDTLCEISKLTGYSVDALANFNDIRNVNLIYADSILRIPSE